MIVARDTRPLTARRILLATLCLLACATSASAECAWVLWTIPAHETPNGGVNSDYGQPWHVAQAFGSQTECANWSSQAFGDAKTHRLVPLDSGNFWSPSAKRLVMCLPDTVDPRGPKGK